MPRSKSELTHVASVDDEGEPIPPPATKVIAGRPGTTSYSPATPKTPRQAHILANEPGSLGTVKRYKLFSDI